MSATHDYIIVGGGWHGGLRSCGPPVRTGGNLGSVARNWPGYPATGKVISSLHSATPAIVDQALASARDAQKARAVMSGTERGRVLHRAADIMRKRNYNLSVPPCSNDALAPVGKNHCVEVTKNAQES